MRHSFRFIQNITTLYNICFTKESFETLKLKVFEIKNIKPFVYYKQKFYSLLSSKREPVHVM